MVSGVAFEKISKDQSWGVFDRAARRLLNMSGEEVARRWDAGELADDRRPELMRVLMLRPSGR
jgi:hypothetical protein